MFSVSSDYPMSRQQILNMVIYKLQRNISHLQVVAQEQIGQRHGANSLSISCGNLFTSLPFSMFHVEMICQGVKSYSLGPRYSSFEDFFNHAFVWSWWGETGSGSSYSSAPHEGLLSDEGTEKELRHFFQNLSLKVITYCSSLPEKIAEGQNDGQRRYLDEVVQFITTHTIHHYQERHFLIEKK